MLAPNVLTPNLALGGQEQATAINPAPASCVGCGGSLDFGEPAHTLAVGASIHVGTDAGGFDKGQQTIIGVHGGIDCTAKHGIGDRGISPRRIFGAPFRCVRQSVARAEDEMIDWDFDIPISRISSDTSHLVFDDCAVKALGGTVAVILVGAGDGDGPVVADFDVDEVAICSFLVKLRFGEHGREIHAVIVEVVVLPVLAGDEDLWNLCVPVKPCEPVGGIDDDIYGFAAVFRKSNAADLDILNCTIGLGSLRGSSEVAGLFAAIDGLAIRIKGGEVVCDCSVDRAARLCQLCCPAVQ